MIDALSKEKVLAGDVSIIDYGLRRMFMAFFHCIICWRHWWIKPELREQINSEVAKWREEGNPWCTSIYLSANAKLTGVVLGFIHR